MSANRDRDQRVTFVYSNFYQLYKKGKEAAHPSEPTSLGRQTSAILKAGDRHAAVQNYEPIALMAKRAKTVAAAPQLVPQIQAKAPVAPSSVASSPIDSLKENLKTLNELHSRLNFMLKELEELVRE